VLRRGEGRGERRKHACVVHEHDFTVLKGQVRNGTIFCALSLHALEDALPVVEDGGARRYLYVPVRHHLAFRPLHSRLLAPSSSTYSPVRICFMTACLFVEGCCDGGEFERDLKKEILMMDTRCIHRKMHIYLHNIPGVHNLLAFT